MANGLFVITEVPTPGDPANADQGERFEWTADSRPTAAFDGTRGGGARACPIKPWAQPGKLRTVRTDYPDALIPTEQVMGPAHENHVFRGRWDDRYNGAGYARFEKQRFVRMCRRGNPVRIQYQDQVFEGLIVQWTPSFEKGSYIPYEFSVSIHNEPEENDRSRVPITPPDTATQLDRVDFAVQSILDADQLAPRHTVAGELADDVSTLLVSATTSRDALASSIDARNTNPPDQPVDGFTRIATQFRATRAAAFNLLLRLGGVRADLDMSVQTAISTLDFEDWIRSMRFAARIAVGEAQAGDEAATEHADPSATRLYRPQAGEHLYAISRKFYGTPHAWGLIYERNALRTFITDGTEILIIPERGGV